MKRATASDRVLRILAILPWIAENDGPTIDDVSDRFDIGADELIEDLDLVLMLGVPPYTPDVMLEAWVDDNRVFAMLGGRLARPPRFTPAQALAIVAAASTLTRLEPDGGPLHTAVEKLERLLPSGDDAVDLSAPADPGGVAPLLRAAIAAGEVVRLDYYSYARDERSEREIEPLELYVDQGEWYVDAWCRDADGERSFRLDRIHRAETTGSTFDPGRRSAVERLAFGIDRRVTVDIDGGAEWQLTGYPVLERHVTAGGRVRLTLAVTEDAWLTRLALRIAPDGVIVEPQDESDRAALWARRILERYETPD